MVRTGGNLRLGFHRLHSNPALVEDCGVQLAGCGPRQRIAHARGDLDRGNLCSDLRSGDAGAPLLDVDLTCADEPCVAIDAGARVPTQIRLMRVVHANGDEVRLTAKVEMWAEFIQERNEAVGPRAQMLAIDPHIAALVYAVELKQDAASCIAARKLKGLAIPADAGRQVGSRASARLRFAEGPADAPVVRQSHRSPASAGELRGLRVGDVPLGKAPPIVEAQSTLAGRSGCRSCLAGQSIFNPDCGCNSNQGCIAQKNSTCQFATHGCSSPFLLASQV